MLAKYLCVVCLSGPSAFAQTTSRVGVDSGGAPATWSCDDASLSIDGSLVAFHTPTPSLVPIDPGLDYDVFVHDRSSGGIEIVSVDSNGNKGNGSSFAASISGDGRRVAFTSGANNLVPGDSNGFADIFVHDRTNGVTQIVSVDSSGVLGNKPSSWSSLSADGRYVAFASYASNLVATDTNEVKDVFVHDRLTGLTERVSVSSTGAQANASSGPGDTSGNDASGCISGDGRWVVFDSNASNLVRGDTNAGLDVFARDRLLGLTRRVSVDSSGNQVSGNQPVFLGTGTRPAISRDGRFVTFSSGSSQLVPGDTNGSDDVFVHDLVTGATERVSMGSTGNQASSHSYQPVLSGDGQFIAFTSQAGNLIPGDTNLHVDIFVRDRLLGTTTRVNVSTLGVQADGTSSQSAIVDDGSAVVFQSFAGSLIAGGQYSEGSYELFLHDLAIWAPVTSYCTAKTNSIGCVPFVTSAGAPRISGYDAFFLVGMKVFNQKNGVFFWGTGQANLPFGGGTLCVQPPLTRTPVIFSGGDLEGENCTGQYSYQFRQDYMAANGVSAGATIYGQFWSRDPGFAAPENIGLTNAICFTVAP